MEIKKYDYTLLSPITTWKEVNALIESATAAKAEAVVIPPSFVKKAKGLNPSVKIATVVGFPGGYSTVAAKVYEAKNAIKAGADEVFAMLNLGNIKAKKGNDIGKEIKKLLDAVKGAPLGVVIEAGIFNSKELAKACLAISAEKPAYVVPSSGFAKGATEATLADLKENLSVAVKLASFGAEE